MTILILLTRFVAGYHLNGRSYNDATWWLDASPKYKTRRGAYTWWRRKSRGKRAAWRHCILWSAVLVIWAFTFYTFWAILGMGVCVPVILYLGFRKLRSLLLKPISIRHSDGSASQHWMIQPRVRRIIQRKAKPGIVPKSEKRKEVRIEDVPSELAVAVLHETTELGEDPPHELKLLMSPD